MNKPLPEEPHFEIPPSQKLPTKGPWKKILGIILIVLGAFGIFLPFVPGVFLIVAGAYLLESKWIQAKIEKIKNFFKRKNK